MWIFIVVSLRILLFGLFLCLIRNNQVFTFRTTLSNQESEYLEHHMELFAHHKRFVKYSSLPSYETMVLKFWIPVNKFGSQQTFDEIYKEVE